MADPQVLANGQYRSPMSVGFLLSDQDEPHTRAKNSISRPERTTGVLSRTMVRSPVVKWILPARIRREEKNDVLFVGERSIELKDFSQGRHLQSVAVKSDFDSDIRSVCVFTPWIRPVKKDENEAGREKTNADTQSDKPDSNDQGKTESDSKSKAKSSTRASMDVDGQEHTLPPQALVLALQSGIRDNLVFMFAYHDHSRHVKFITYNKPLPASSSFNRETTRTTRLGAHTAIEPRSRAMAVAAEAGQLLIMNLKSRKTIFREVVHPFGYRAEEYRPIRHERLLDIKGAILNIAFLRPPKDAESESTVYLAVLIRPLGRITATKSYLMWTEWDSAKDPHDFEIEWRRFPLPNSEIVPSLFIPVMLASGLLLACRDRMYFYQDLLSGYTKPQEIAYEEHTNEDGLDQDDSSRGPPMYTGWARPFRRFEHTQKWDSFYLCREDGAVSFCEIGTRGNSGPIQFHEHIAGKVRVNVDSAFACLDNGIGNYPADVDHGSFDVLAIAGNTSDGGLFEFATRKFCLPRLQRINNWAPTMDFTVISKPEIGDLTNGIRKIAPCNLTNKDRLFTCANRGRSNGNLCEMRYGLEAQSIFDFDVQSLGENIAIAINHTWLLPEQNQNTVPEEVAQKPDNAILLVSYPDASDRATISWEGKVVDNDTTSYAETLLDRSCSTIAVSTTKDHLAILVNERSVRAIGIPGPGRIPFDLTKYSFESAIATHASIEGLSSSCLVSLRTVSKYCVSIIRISEEDGKIQILPDSGDSVSPPAEVSCTFLTRFGRTLLGFVGLVDGRLLTYDCTGDRPVQLCEHIFIGDIAICESIRVIYKSHNYSVPSYPTILCGLRNGTVHILHLLSNAGISSLHFSEKLDIGPTGVSIFADNAIGLDNDDIPIRALALSGECFCRLFYESEDADDITIQCIWITQPDLRGLRTEELRSIAQYAPWDKHGSAFDKALLCMDEQCGRLVRLASEARSVAVPRKIQVKGSPTRVGYLTQMEQLVVAFEFSFIPGYRAGSGSGRKPRRRLVYPMIKIIHPDDEGVDMKDEDSDDEESAVDLPRGCTVVGASGGKILGIVEWIPRLHGKSWTLLAINTLQVQDNGARSSGSIFIYHLEKTGHDVKVTLKKTIKQDQPVTAMASLEPNSLVFGIGTDLVVQQLTIQDGGMKFTSIARKAITGPAKHISIGGSNIYVSMAQGSVASFALEGHNVVERLNDHKDRAGHHHVFLPDCNMIIASDMSSAVRGLLCPPQETIDSSFQTVFEARLPSTISRLRLTSLNPRRGSVGRRDRQEIIGSGFGGQFYSFELLAYDEWRLLCFIKNLARRSCEICPFRYEEYLREPVEPVPNETNMHIDGDVLVRLLQYGNLKATNLLRDLVREAAHSGVDYTSASEAEERLGTFVKSALQNGDSEDPYQAVIRFMRSILQIDS